MMYSYLMATNPYRAAREAKIMSQQELSRLISLSPQSILRTEQGTFTTPPVALQRYFKRIPLEAYTLWQTAHRKESRLNTSSSTTSSNQSRSTQSRSTQILYSPNNHPLINVMYLSGCRTLTAFCVDMCLHIPSMQKFYNEPWGANNPPSTLTNALLDIWAVEEVQRFTDAYTAYRKQVLKTQAETGRFTSDAVGGAS